MSLQTCVKNKDSVPHTDNVVAELSEAGQLRGAVGTHVQDVPHILIGSLETAEPATGDIEIRGQYCHF